MKNLIQLSRNENEKLYIVATGKRVRSLEKTELNLIRLTLLDKQEIRKEIYSLAEQNYAKMNSYEIYRDNTQRFEEEYFFIKFHRVKDKYVKKTLKCDDKDERELNF